MSALKRRREAYELRAKLADKKARMHPRASHVPKEVFTIIVRTLQDCPSTLLRLSMVCRDARDLVLRESDELWYEILRKSQVSYFSSFMSMYRAPSVVRGIPMRPPPNFKDVEGYAMGTTMIHPVTWQIRRATWPHVGGVVTHENPFTPAELRIFARYSIRTTGIQASHCCGVCRSTVKLQPVWGLGMKVCNACLKDNLISGAALFYEYDLSFSALADKLAGRVFCFHSTFKHGAMRQFVSYNPLDFDMANAQSMVFFWRPHLRRVVDLDAARRKLRDPERSDAAKKLTSSVRALFTRIHLSTSGKYSWLTSHRYYVNAPAWPQKNRPRSPHNVRDLTEPERALLAGGFLHSVLRASVVAQELQARRLLQERFLGYRGSCALPSQKHPALALEKLRAYESTRSEYAIKRRPPNIHSSACTPLKRWFDLPPSLAGVD